jgi:two-component system response regulator NreC
MAKIRILIADDHAVLRAGLRMLLSAQPDMEVVGEAADAHEAVRKAIESRAHVVLMDITMPGGSGIQAIGRIRQGSPRTRVLVLTMHDDPAYVRAALAAGGSGHVVKEVESSELLAAIRAIHRGRTFVDLSLAGHSAENALLGGATRGPARQRGPARLSQRELRVLELVVQGHTNQRVADRLSVSIKTVETYRARIRDKLGLKTRADLVRFALETGLLRPGKSNRAHSIE